VSKEAERICIQLNNDMVYEVTHEVQEKLKDWHPSMFIGYQLSMNMYQVKYSYTTTRGNMREGTKIVLMNNTDSLDPYEAEIMVEGQFQQWLNGFNTLYPYKALENVEILSIMPYARAMVALG